MVLNPRDESRHSCQVQHKRYKKKRHMQWEKDSKEVWQEKWDNSNKKNPLKVPPRQIRDDLLDDVYQVTKKHEWELRFMDIEHRKVVYILDKYTPYQLDSDTKCLDDEDFYIKKNLESFVIKCDFIK